jgi:hypothetical protein
MPRYARSTSAPKLSLPHVHYRRDSAQNNSPSSPDRAPPVENGCFSVRLHQRVHPSKPNLQRVCGFSSSYLHPIRNCMNLAGLIPVPRASERRECCREGEQPRCHHTPLRYSPRVPRRLDRGFARGLLSASSSDAHFSTSRPLGRCIGMVHEGVLRMKLIMRRAWKRCFNTSLPESGMRRTDRRNM